MFDSAALLRTMLELTVELSKQKKKKKKEKKKQAPTVNSSIFTYIVSNECMVIYMWKEKNNNLRLTKIDMEKRWNAKQKPSW
jgi:hypothetical protein